MTTSDKAHSLQLGSFVINVEKKVMLRRIAKIKTILKTDCRVMEEVMQGLSMDVEDANMGAIKVMGRLRRAECHLRLVSRIQGPRMVLFKSGVEITDTGLEATLPMKKGLSKTRSMMLKRTQRLKI